MPYHDYFPRYVRVAERRARAERLIRKMREKDRDLQPVILSGRSLACTWWGKAWNNNLEGYADYSNRIARGRSYVRNMAVVDLRITAGRVSAQVAGSQSRPYTVGITIKTLPAETWEAIVKECAGELHSLQELLAGRFPKSIGERFTSRRTGLFPSPDEIAFDCSCPDWAHMCKHVAAVLYGIGVRLDEAPELLFTLRNVVVDELVATTVRGVTDHLLDRAGRKRDGAVGIAELSDMFGIEMDDAAAAKTSVSRTSTGKTAAKGGRSGRASQSASHRASHRATQSATQRKTGRTSGSSGQAAGSRSQAAGRIRSKTTGKKGTQPAGTVSQAAGSVPGPQKAATVLRSDSKTILGIIRRSRKGVDFSAIQKKSGLPEKKIRSTIATLHRKGEIRRISRGVYKGR